MAVCIWDPRWLTMCAVIRTMYITWFIYLLHYCTYIKGSSMWRVLACYFLGLLFTDWAPGCYVHCGWIGSPVFSFPFVGGEKSLSTCSLQSVIAFCFGSAASCLVGFLWGGYWLLRAVVSGLLSLCDFHFLRGWMASLNLGLVLLPTFSKFFL